MRVIPPVFVTRDYAWTMGSTTEGKNETAGFVSVKKILIVVLNLIFLMASKFFSASFAPPVYYPRFPAIFAPPVVFIPNQQRQKDKHKEDSRECSKTYRRKKTSYRLGQEVFGNATF